MYKFTQKDLKFVQNLYIDSICVNFSMDFFKEIENYFSKVGQVNWNNTGYSWWIYQGK